MVKDGLVQKNMNINMQKTKAMIVVKSDTIHDISIEGKRMEQVDECTYYK